MTETKQRTVLLASMNLPERNRLKKALEPVFAERNETPIYREIDDYRDLIKEWQLLKENLVTLVVLSGFGGYWHTLFRKLTKLVESEIAGVLMHSKPLTLQKAQEYGLRSVPTALGERGVAQAVREQLAKLTV